MIWTHFTTCTPLHIQYLKPWFCYLLHFKFVVWELWISQELLLWFSRKKPSPYEKLGCVYVKNKSRAIKWEMCEQSTQIKMQQFVFMNCLVNIALCMGHNGMYAIIIIKSSYQWNVWNHWRIFNFEIACILWKIVCPSFLQATF
jgi:hypothetical protein